MSDDELCLAHAVRRIALWSTPSESGFIRRDPARVFPRVCHLNDICHAPVIFRGLRAFDPVPRNILRAFRALQASLLLRIGSDFAGRETGRMHGGLLNVAAILLFLASTIYSAVKSRLDGPSAS